MTTALLEPTTEEALPRPLSARASASVAEVEERLFRLSLDQYHRLAESEVLGPKDRVVLIEGLLVAKITKHQPHILASCLVDEFLHRALPPGWFTSSQNPVTIAESASEPEPDAIVVRGAIRDYATRRVTPADVALVVEVADSSVKFDHGLMKRLYAEASIPTYWVVDIPARRVVVYTDPTGLDPSPNYRRRVDLGPDDELSLTLDAREITRIRAGELLT